jgi:hypothetical protein
VERRGRPVLLPPPRLVGPRVTPGLVGGALSQKSGPGGRPLLRRRNGRPRLGGPPLHGREESLGPLPSPIPIFIPLGRREADHLRLDGRQTFHQLCFLLGQERKPLVGLLGIRFA